jgi:hypothetical protein
MSYAASLILLNPAAPGFANRLTRGFMAYCFGALAHVE